MQFPISAPEGRTAPKSGPGAHVCAAALSSVAAMKPRRRRATPLAAAIAGLLANGSALALSLGPLEVNSALGEPLRAELALGVAPGERLTPACFRLTTDATAGARGGMAYAANLRLTGNGPAQRLVIDGRTPMREPLVDLVVAVDCPGAPRVERGYTLMLSPAGREPRPTAATAPATAGLAASPERPPAAAPSARPVPAQPRADAPPRAVTPAQPRPAGAAQPRPAEALTIGDRYRVRPGDTLSTIAQRVSDREGTLWEQAEAIFAANPAAFINADRNLLRAGALLEIPGRATTTPRASRPAAALPVAALPVAALNEITPQIGVRPDLPVATGSVNAAVDVSAITTAAPAATVSAAASRAAQLMGPPRPEQLATVAATGATVTATAADEAPRQAGLRGWLAGLLVGLGFISLGALLGWSALRRRPTDAQAAAAPEEPVLSDLETTVHAGVATAHQRVSAPPPRFSHSLQDSGSYTVEITTLPEPSVAEEQTTTGRAVPDETPTDEVALLLDIDGPLEQPVSSDTGDTTITHRFEGFSDTEALDLQMAEAMAMLERDYTSRFQTAVSLDDTGSIDATDTLHALPSEVTQSLEDLQASVEDDAPEHAADEDVAASGERTALMQTPDQRRVGNG